jgi:site-specific recombinase XerD
MTQRETLSILFYLRNDKAKSTTEVPIYLRITVNGKRSEMAVHRYVDPKKWSAEAGYVRGTKAEAKKLNEFLDLQRSRVYEAQRDLTEDGKVVTALALRERVQGKSEGQKTLVEVFRYHNQLMKEKVPQEYSPLTMKRFETTLGHTQDYLRYKYKTNDILLSQLDHQFISEFEHYFRTVRGCNHNTSIKYLKNLKKVVLLAVKNDWLRKDPFTHFNVKLKPVKREFLSQEELSALENLEIGNNRLDQVRDVFVFSCYTGYAHVDVKQLTPDNVVRGIDGGLWIQKDRQKTDTKSNVPLLPKALEIIDKYKDHPQCLSRNTLLPVPSNQKTNAYLKEIANLAGIKKNLTFHLARHTCATIILLANDMNIEVVAEILGHQDLRTTQIYAKVLEKSVGEGMEKVRQKLVQKGPKRDEKDEDDSREKSKTAII